ncbi:MAG: DMT family transporter [Anaerolineae bacterium]
MATANRPGARSVPGVKGMLLVVLATACWSTSGLFVSFIIAKTGLSALGLAFWRDLGTFACLLCGLALVRPRLLRVRQRDLPWLAAMGAISIGGLHILWNTGVLVNGVSVSTAFQANSPIFVTVAAWFVWREPLSGRKIGAIGLALCGTALIARLDSLGQAGITPYGLFLGLGVAVSFGALSLFGKKLAGAYSPWTVLVYIFGFGALALLPFQGDRTLPPWPLPTAALGSFAGLLLVSTITGFALYTTSLRHLQAGVAIIGATTEVPLAAIAAYLILGERLDARQLLGALLVVGGVVLLSWPRRATRAPSGSTVAERNHPSL